MSTDPEPASGSGLLPPTDDLEEIERRLRMPLVEAMTTQRSIRRIHPDPVDPAVVRRLLELALEAPTGSNGQNWEFIVVTDRAVKAKFARQNRRILRIYGGLGRRFRSDDQTLRILKSVDWQADHFTEIPVLVVACLKNGARPPLLPVPALADSSHYGSIYPSVQNLLLGARAIGLGASLITLPLWSGIASRRFLGLPPNVDPACIVCLGWPIGKYGPKHRRPVDDVLHRNRWKGE